MITHLVAVESDTYLDWKSASLYQEFSARVSRVFALECRAVVSMRCRGNNDQTSSEL
jgi:hypothetical protein